MTSSVDRCVDRARARGEGGEALCSRTSAHIRFSAIAVALTALLLPAAASAETLRVGKAGRDAFSFAPADIGARTGIFKKHGIDLEISSFGGDARVQQAMAADGIDIGLGSGPGLAFIVKGSPAKGIAAMADPPLTFALVVRNDGDDQDARRSQGQEGRRLDRRLGHRLARRRDRRARRAGATTAWR